MADVLVTARLDDTEVTAALTRIGGATGTLTDRMGNAFQRLEAREPTMVLRRVRGEIEMLAASALGSTGPLGRLAASLAMFGIGSTTGLVAVAGLAAIGFEMKKIIDYSDGLDKNLLKLNTTLAGGGRAGMLFKSQAALQRGADLVAPGFLEMLVRGVTGGDRETGAGGLGGLSDAMAQNRAAERATAATESSLESTRLHNEGLRAEKERTKAVEESVLALDKARLGLHPTTAQLEMLAHRADVLTLSLEHLTGPQQARIEHLNTETRALERVNALHEAMLNRPASAGTGNLTQAGVGFIPRGATYGTAPQIGWFGRPEEEDRSGLTDLGRVGVMGAGGGRVGAVSSSSSAEGRTRDINLAVGAAMATISGLARGDAAGAIGGLGSAATALSGMKSLASAAPVLGPAGIALSVISSLFSLFSSGQATVMIAGYSSKALSQQQQLLLALTGFKGLNIDILSAGGDVDRVLYALGRAGRTDGNMRVPGGGRG
jgi:hypothetical protein